MYVVSSALQQHRFSYNEAMPVESCTQALSDLALRFGEDDDEEGEDFEAEGPEPVGKPKGDLFVTGLTFKGKIHLLY